MAGRGLGTLTLDLAVKIGGFTAGLDKAGRELDKKTRQMQKNAEKFGRDLGVALKVGLGLAATGLGIYIKNTIEAEKVQKQLASRIADTGMAAGRTLQQLNAQAEKLQSVTVFDDESIGEAQAALMTFTQVTGREFDRTIEAATDLATVMGTDVAAAAKVLGKALSDPEKGIGALRKAGITLTEDQKALVKELQNAGNMAGAQGVILDALAGKMGTAAEAARDTLGGALQGLQNAFNNLLEGDGSSAGVRDATEAVNDFSASLNSPEAKQGIESIITGLVKLAGWVGTVGGAFVKSAQQIGNAMGLIGQYAGALSDYTAAAIKGDEAAQTAARQKFLAGYKQFVEETKRVRDGAGSPVRGPVVFEDPPPARGKRPEEGAAARAKAAADAAKNATKAASEAKRQAAEAARRQAEAEDDLRDKLEKVKKASDDFTSQLEDLRAAGDPLAEAQLAYNRALADTREQAEAGEVGTKKLAEAEALLAAQYGKTTAEIRERLDTGGQQIKQMEAELSLMQMQTQAERDRAAFLMDNPTASDAQADRAAALAGQLDDTREAISAMDEFRSTFEDSVVDVVTGAKSISEAFKNMADQIVAQITRMIAQQWTEKLFDEYGSTGGGSAGGWLSSLFGMAMGSGSGGGAGSSGSFLDAFGGSYANGTNFAPGGMSLVGERGPEIVNLPRGAQVIPNHKLGGDKWELHFHGNTTKETAQYAANKVAQKLAFSRRG